MFSSYQQFVDHYLANGVNTVALNELCARARSYRFPVSLEKLGPPPVSVYYHSPDLRGATLKGVNMNLFFNANFSGADLRGADFSKMPEETEITIDKHTQIDDSAPTWLKELPAEASKLRDGYSLWKELAIDFAAAEIDFDCRVYNLWVCNTKGQVVPNSAVNCPQAFYAVEPDDKHKAA